MGIEVKHNSEITNEHILKVFVSMPRDLNWIGYKPTELHERAACEYLVGQGLADRLGNKHEYRRTLLGDVFHQQLCTLIDFEQKVILPF